MSLLVNNPELRDCFESDAVRILNELTETLETLIWEPPALDFIAKFHELAHTLRGAAALVEIEPVALVCGDYMRLAEIADSFKYSAWDRALQIFSYARASLDTLRQAVMATIGGDESAAGTLCPPLSAGIRERWNEYFYHTDVTEEEGGFDAYHAVGENEVHPSHIEAVEAFLISTEQAAEGGSVEHPESVADFLNSVDTSAEPIAASDEMTGGFLGAMAAAAPPEVVELIPHVTSESGAPVLDVEGAAVDFLSTVTGPAEAPVLAEKSGDRGGIAAAELAGPEIDPELLPYLFEDARSNLDSLGWALRTWEAEPNDLESLKAIHRHIHTIKGAARSTGLPALGAMANAVEDVIEDCLEQKLQSPLADVVALIHRMEDGINAAITELSDTKTLSANLVNLAAIIDQAHALRGVNVVEEWVGVVGNEGPGANGMEAAGSGKEIIGETVVRTGSHAPMDAQIVDDFLGSVGDGDGELNGLILGTQEHGEPTGSVSNGAVADSSIEVRAAGDLEIQVPSQEELVADFLGGIADVPQVFSNPDEAGFDGESDLGWEAEEEQLAEETQDEVVARDRQPFAAATPAPSFEADLLPFFYEDALTNIESLEGALHAWEQNPEDVASLQSVYRHTHTIKGAANSTGLADMGRMIHIVEDVLEACVEGALALPSAAVAGLVYQMVDGIRAGMSDLQAHGAFGESLTAFGAVAAKAEALRHDTSAVETDSIAEPVHAEVAEEISRALPAPAVAGESPETQSIRISAQRLDAVMNLIGELIISRTRLDKKILDIARLKEELNFCKTRLLEAIGSFHERFEYSRRQRLGGWRGGASNLSMLGLPGESVEGFSELEFDRYDEFNIMARSLVETGNDISEVISQLDGFFSAFNEESNQFSKTTTSLQNEVTRIRMVPLTVLFRRLQRSVRDAATREGKEVEVHIAGGDTQIDKNIVDEIYSPLLHLVRNSVSHGIENADVRARSGKAGRGNVSIRAFQESNQVIIEVSDDGAGLDFAAIRATAIEQGILSADVPVTEDELTNLIFRAGFSTARSLSEISGRGVGMDVVSVAMSRLNGSIEVRSVRGKGCTFVVRLPLTLAINQAMMISVAGRKFALPLGFVEHIVPWRPEGMILSGDRELWRTESSTVPFVRLDRIFGLPPVETRRANVVLVRVANKSLALLLDDQLTRQDIVVKPLGSLLAGTFFSGATLSGDGDVILILDLPAIEQNFRNQASTRPSAAPVRPKMVRASGSGRAKVLVVDDSLSVRKVAEKYLAAIGYEAVLAVDGLDALEKLRAEKELAAVLTDLEMPRLHGYELIAEIRKSPTFGELPVIVVTSRDAEKHRKRALELGASGYITKPFSREQLAERLDALTAAPADA